MSDRISHALFYWPKMLLLKKLKRPDRRYIRRSMKRHSKQPDDVYCMGEHWKRSKIGIDPNLVSRRREKKHDSDFFQQVLNSIHRVTCSYWIRCIINSLAIVAVWLLPYKVTPNLQVSFFQVCLETVQFFLTVHQLILITSQIFFSHRQMLMPDDLFTLRLPIF